MALVVVTMKIMPESPDSDLEGIKKEALQIIEAYAGKGDTKVEIIPIAFGLSAVQIMFIMNEALGSTEPLEKSISSLPQISSVDITDVRRAIG